MKHDGNNGYLTKEYTYNKIIEVPYIKYVVAWIYPIEMVGCVMQSPTL